MQHRSVVELGFQPALIVYHVYPGCRCALPRADMSCAFSARGAKLENGQLAMDNVQLEMYNNKQ